MVRFYDGDTSLARIVAEFLIEGFETGSPGIVIATAIQRAAIIRELTHRAVDVVGLERSRDLLLLDTQHVLSAFMADGMPDVGKFHHEMCRAIEHVCRGRATSTVRIFGQIVDVLWQQGQRDAAVRLEVLCNELAQSDAFSLRWRYSVGHFYKEANNLLEIVQKVVAVSTRTKHAARARPDWISGACPRCLSAETVRTVLANATAFTCSACGHDWAVRRMPSDAEAARILRHSRQIRTRAPLNPATAEVVESS